MFRSIPEEVTREWFDTEQVGPIAFQLPEPDIDYAYAAARLLSWYPVVNSKGATYFPDDVDDDTLQTLIGKQANLQHDKTRIIGTIFAAQKTDEGIDVGVRIDRECADLQGMDLNEMRSGNYFSHVSVELTKDPDQSWFYGVDEGFNIIDKVPVLVGRDQGIRRTTAADPYALRGNRVVERIKPARFTGVGFVPNPADKTAALYAVAASEDTEDTEKSQIPSYIDVESDDHEFMSKDALTPGKDYADPGFQKDGKKRYPLDTPEHVRSAARFFARSENRDKYKGEHLKHIDAAIARAKKRYGIGDNDTKQSASTDELPKEIANVNEAELKARIEALEADVARLTSEKEQASADATNRVNEIQAALDTAKAELATKETELASVTAERDTLKTEKETAAREAAVNALVDELVAILPAKDDEELATLRETAAQYVDDHGRIHVIKLERRNAALEAKVAELSAPPSGETPAGEAPAGEPPAGETPASGKEGEQASDETFVGGAKPKVAVGPVYTASNGKTYSAEELTEVF